MTRWDNTAEGGTLAAAVTAANSGGTSGTAFSAVTGTVVYDGTFAHGAKSHKFTPVASSGNTLTWGNSGSPLGGTSFAARACVNLSALPPDSNTIIAITRDGTNRIASLGFEQNGKFLVRDSATVLLTSVSGIVTTNTWLTFELWGTISATAELHGRVYTGDSTSSILSQYDTTSAANTGTTTPQSVSFGKFLASTAWASDYRIDDESYDNAATGYIGNAGPMVTGVVTPTTADTGIARTLTLTMTNGNGNAITWGPVNWGDGLANDSAVTTAAGVTSKTFTRTPSSAGVNKSGSFSWSQA